MLSREELLKIKFTNLIQHSHWSIPLGIGNVKKQIQGTHKKGLSGFAITDLNVMSGVLETYFLSKDKEFLEKNKIDKLPIALGVRLNFTDNLENKDLSRIFELTLFAKSMTGYKNLIYLNSVSSDPDHFFEKPRLSSSELIEKSEDIVIGSGGINGILGQAIVKGTGQEEDLIQIFKESFGDNFFIEIHYRPIKQHWDVGSKKYLPADEDVQKAVNLRLIELAKKYDVKCCLVQNSYMVEEKHFSLQSILIQNHPDYKKLGWIMDQPYQVMSVEEMYHYIQKNSSYITDEMFLEFSANTQHILDLCKNIKLEFYPSLPKIKYEEHVVNVDSTYEDKIKELQKEMIGFCNLMAFLIEKSETDISLRTTIKTIIRLNKIDWKNKSEVDRLAFELRVMQRNGVIGLCDYFLLLEDVTNYVVSIGKYRGFGRGCFSEDALVLTESGYKKIVDVKPGDSVYSHLGNNKKVIKTFKYTLDKNETMLKVFTQKSYNPLTLTKDHKVYGIKRKTTKYYDNSKFKNKRKKYENFDKKDLIFDKISNFKEGDILFTKTPNKRKIVDIKNVDLSKFISKNSYFKVLKDKIELYNSRSFVGKPRISFSRFIDFNEEFAYIVGKWIGDGCYKFNEEKGSYAVCFAFNSKERKEINKTTNFFKKLGLSVGIYPSKKSKLVQIEVYSKPLSLYFKQLFPNYKSTAITKYIGKLKLLPNNKLKSLIIGLKSADGYDIDSFGGDRRESIDSISKTLIEEVRECLMYLNIPSKVSLRKSHFCKSLNCQVKDSYKITFLGLEINKKGHQKEFITDDGFFSKILKFEEISKVENVYDLMVEDDNSFLTSEYTVHNSGGGSFLTYVLDISDIQPLKYDLLFERFLTKERIGTYFFDVPGYEFKNNEHDDFTNPFFEKLKSKLIESRIKEVNSLYFEKELFYLECNPNVTEYLYTTLEDLLSKNLKVENKVNSSIFYCLGITDSIPTEFIKSTPTTLPDFDYDTDARDEVKEYLTNKYGKNHVTLMGTIGTLKTKGALKDIIRQLRPLKSENGDIIKPEMSFNDVNELSKKFNLLKPTDFKTEIEFFEESLKADAGLKKWFSENKDIYDSILMLLGNAKSTGIHAGGIVISAQNVLEVMPMTWSFDENMWITQSEMAYVERVGLIKYDFLGLKTLGDLNRVLKLVNSRYNKNYNLSNIPMDEKDVLNLFVQGKTESVFQFNTDLAVSILIQLKEIRSILDLAMITSIARPGPLQMGMDKTFIARNTGKEPVEYLHPTLKPILNETYGILCYQENIISVAKQVGDFDNDSSVSIMKALSKKQLEKVLKYKEKFLKNAQKHGYTISKAELLWNLLESFAAYGFNKSHAAAYGAVSYLCMWFKHHYPLEWYSSVLSGADKDDFKILYPKWKDYINKPDINRSKDSFNIDDTIKKVVMPLNAINGVGIKAVENIIKNQPYESFEDFFKKVDKRQVNKKTVISLIFSGVFDSMKKDVEMSENKWRKLLILEFLKLKYSIKKPLKSEKEEDDLFIKEIANMNRGSMLMKEISLLNFTAFNYFEYYKDKMTDGARQKFGYEAITPGKVAEYPDGATVVVGGSIESIVIAPVKNPKSKIFGQEMVRIKLSNSGETIDLVLFPKQLQDDDKAGGMIRTLVEYTPVVIKGRVSRFGGGLSITYEAGWVLI